MANETSKQAIEEEVELEMTPMIDVVFLLLIFFMCTLKMITVEGQFSTFLPKDQGTAAASTPPEIDKLKIRIVMKGEYKAGVRNWEFRAPSWKTDKTKALQKYVITFVTRSPKAPIEISPGTNAPYEAMIELLNACVGAKADKINFSMLPVPSKPK
ncbi:MAG: biopolymer transporter ExbD [Planctomycetota bacterium]|jgi:biopolymer transport protein ExbD|nr:biopolymer transporter ExbD [Planctomycetota bacterium]